MTDISKHPLIREAYELCLQIEKFPPSELQTETVLMASKLVNGIDALVTETKDHVNAVDEENFHLIQQRDAAHESARNAEANYTAQQAITQLFKAERDAAADLAKEECAKICDEIANARDADTSYIVEDCAEAIRAHIADLESVRRTMEDAAMLDWCLPILTAQGEIGDRRAMALAAQFIKGLDGREAIDAARKGEEGKR